MEWIPIVFVTFKVLVLGTGMYYAIKWHYDRGRKKRAKEQGCEQDWEQEKRALLRAAAQVAAIFVVGLLVLGLIAWALVSTFNLDMNL